MAPNSKLPPRRVVQTFTKGTHTDAGKMDVGDILIDDRGHQWVVTESPAHDGTAAGIGGRTYRNGWIE